MPHATLVLTTISDAAVLDSYYRNFRDFGHLDEVCVIIVPDRKTPAGVFETCERLRERGLDARCPSLEMQEAFLKRIGVAPEFVPYDSDNRRNIGFLLAIEAGSDFLISIDDDNYCREDDDFFAAHAVTCESPVPVCVTACADGMMNVCELLEFTHSTPVYPRGYPYGARFKETERRETNRAVSVVLNAGLWLHDPDVDAITCLGLRPKAIRFHGRSVVLDRGTWCPINTQNTSVRRALIPAYYFIRMGHVFDGVAVDRYGDIFSGYFAQACAKHLGGAVRFGTPIVDHLRNAHDYMRDASAEWPAILILEEFVPWLMSTRLSGSSCTEAYCALASCIDDAADQFHGAGWRKGAGEFLHETARDMRTWLAACETVAGGRTL